MVLGGGAPRRFGLDGTAGRGRSRADHLIGTFPLICYLRLQLAGGTSILSLRRVPDWVESTVAVQRLQSDVGAVASGALDGPSQPSGCVQISSLGGQSLFGLDPTGEYIPASNMKILTATAALDRLGPTDRPTTTVLAEQAPENGVVYGNLYLVGGGDPLLRTTSYAAGLGPSQTQYTSLNQLARQVRQAGIRLVTGDIVGDDGRYDSQRTVATWEPVYSTEGDVGPLSALDVNDGFVPKPPPPRPPPAPRRNRVRLPPHSRRHRARLPRQPPPEALRLRPLRPRLPIRPPRRPPPSPRCSVRSACRWKGRPSAERRRPAPRP